MPVPMEYELSSVVLPGGQITGIREQDVSPGLQEIIESGSGEVDPDFSGILSAKPMLSWTATSIASALALVGYDGVSIQNEDVEFYFRRKALGGTRESTGVRLTARFGIIIPKQIDASHNETATVGMEMMCISEDGEASPITIERDVSVPTIDPLEELFTVGPATINGTTFEAIQKLRIDFGIAASSVGGNGEVYDTFCSIDERRPKIYLDTKEVAHLDDFGVSGIPLTTWVVFLRKLLKGGTREDAGDGVHISLTGNEGLFKPDSVKGQKGWEASWCIHPTGRPPLTINTATSIT